MYLKYIKHDIEILFSLLFYRKRKKAEIETSDEERASRYSEIYGNINAHYTVYLYINITNSIDLRVNKYKWKSFFDVV